jgi:(p)ppGpp synthase/HD superfamily hydrolase
MLTLSKEQEDFILIAKNYAIKCHEETNHKYGDKPYSYHLQMVYDYAVKYCHLLPKDLIVYVLAAAWCHDLIEDARQTYNDVKDVCGERVANIAFALTNEKGKNRAERASDKYYSDMREVEGATYAKICDRLANIKNSVNEGSNMGKKYRKENPNFREHIYSEDLHPMFDEIEQLIS